MKISFSILLFLLLFNLSYAQTSDDRIPSITDLPWQGNSNGTFTKEATYYGNSKPLFIVYSNKKVIMADTILTFISAESIKSFKILRDTAAVKKYGKEMQYNVVELYLDDVKYPDAYKLIKKGAF